MVVEINGTGSVGACTGNSPSRQLACRVVWSLTLEIPDYLCFSFCSYLDAIERAVANGDCLLLENIGESVDPVLDPLLGRLTIKKGRAIKIGDKEIEYHPKFRLILQVHKIP